MGKIVLTLLKDNYLYNSRMESLEQEFGALVNTFAEPREPKAVEAGAYTRTTN